MSEFTQCNFCTHRDATRRAKLTKQKIILRPGASGWIERYMVPADYKERKDKKIFKKYWTGCYMAITDHCVC